MAVIARVLGVSLLIAVLVGGLGLAVFRPRDQTWDVVVLFFVTCVGGVVGAIAGAAREIVSAQRPKAPRWVDTE